MKAVRVAPGARNPDTALLCDQSANNIFARNMWWWLRPWIATREQGISVRPPTRLFATNPALGWPRRSVWRNAGRGRRCNSRNSRDPGGNLFFQMEGAEGWRCYQHLGLSGINWHKLYSCVRIRSGLGPEVVALAGVRGEADRRRGRVDHTLEFRLYAGAQAVIAGFYGREKVRPVAISACPTAINAESRRRCSHVNGNIVGRGCANRLYQCLASDGLRGWVPPLVRFHIKANFIRAATGSGDSVRRGVLSKSGRSKKQYNQGSPEHPGASLQWPVLCMRRARRVFRYNLATAS